MSYNQSSLSENPKAFLFYTYLPPWRIDIFNTLSEYYDLTIFFLNANAKGFTYNRRMLLESLKAKAVFWDKGFDIGGKSFRFGLMDLIRREKPEVIFSHEYSPTSIMLAAMARTKKFNFELVITTSDNLAMAESVGGIKAFARKFVLSNSRRCVVYSNSVKKFYEATFPSLEVSVCPNIQNPVTLLKHDQAFPELISRFKTQYRLGDKVALYVGRLEFVKGLDLLLKAFKNTISDKFQLVLVGEGDQKQELLQLTSELELKDRVFFPGFFSGTELYAWYRMADFFILPSRYEPFGAVVNEALVFGCPVLASKNIGALDYLEEGTNGMIFDPEDCNSFENCLSNAAEFFSEDFNSKKRNLMIRSFEDYIDAFLLPEFSHQYVIS